MKLNISTSLKRTPGTQKSTSAGKKSPMSQDANRLEEIQGEMGELLSEARLLVKKAGGRTYAAASAYWIAHIGSALGNETSSRQSATTMQDTIDELRAE